MLQKQKAVTTTLKVRKFFMSEFGMILYKFLQGLQGGLQRTSEKERERRE